MKNRTVLFLLFLFEILGFSHVAFAQTVLNPAMDESQRPRLLFKGDKNVVFTRTGTTSGLMLKMGTLPGLFTTAAVPFPGASLSVTPNSLSLPIGVIYAVITNSDSNSLAGIQAQALKNPSIVVSNAIGFIVESPNSATAVAPIGNEPNSAPLFRWTTVPGVPAYQIILSKTPFKVTKDPVSGDLSVVGAEIIWRYTTTSNSAVYGSVNANSSISMGTPPPLVVGNEYNYTILNVYDTEGNPAFTSDVFGGVVAFKYTGVVTIDAPVLRIPADNATFYGDNKITFSWDPVAKANLYTFYLFQRVTTTSGAKQEYDVPLWSTSLTGTIVDYTSKGSLARGKYIWYVSVSDAAGHGNASTSRQLNYTVNMGKIKLQAVPSTGSGNLVGLEIRAQALVGGATPTNPFIINNDRIVDDSLVTGTYKFSASKLGYADTAITVEIPVTPANGEAVSVVVPLRALPATISGSVLDQASLPVSGATVQVQNLLTATQQTAITSSAGKFSVSTEGGTYSLQSTKPGYIPSTVVTVNVAVGDQAVIQTPFTVLIDQADISGKIVNDVGTPISLVSVTATAATALGVQTQTAVTDLSGNYAFNGATSLSSGNWSITAAKDGFIPAAPPVQITLAVGDRTSMNNIVLIPRANTINGSVMELLVSSGSSGSVPMKNAIVTARPLVGTDVVTTTSSTGQFALNLKQGTYHIVASQNNYSASPGSQSGYDVTVYVGQTVTGIDFSLQANPSSVSGLVSLSDGTLISGAQISVSGGASVLSGANGAYTIGLSAGSFTLSVSKEGYGAPLPASVSVATGQNLLGVNFQLSPNAAVISGSVVSSGEAVSGATIVARNATTGDSLSSTATATGLFTISVQAGTWSVTASKTGFISASGTVTVGPGQRSSGNVLSIISNTSQIIGTVSDGSAALRNASVAITEIGNSSNALSTTSKDDGSFVVTVTAGKDFTVTVSSVGYVSKTATTGVLVLGKSASLPFTLAIAPSSIAGIVVNTDSKPLYPVKVYAVSQTTGTIDSTTTDNTGAYRFGLASGKFTIVSRVLGYIADSASVSLTIGQTLSSVNLRLTENFAVISGTVTGRSIPLANALVNVSGSNGGATATSGSDGSFLIPRLVGGLYSIKITRTGYGDSTISVQLAGGQSRQFAIDLLALDGKISGSVKTTFLVPIAGASVFVRDVSGKIYSTISGGDGAYSVSSLPSGKYRISAAKSGYTSLKIDSVVLSASVVNATSVIADFTPNSLKVQGLITDDGAGTGISNVSITISGSLGSGSVLTNTRGEYSTNNLALSSYTLTVTKSGFTTVTRTISPNGPSDTVQTFNIALLSNDGSITGSVKDDAGATLPFNVAVKATSRGGSWSTTADALGNFSFSKISRDSTTVATEFFREGYDNVSRVVALSSTQATNVVALEVVPRISELNGSAGAADALLALTESSGRISQRIANSRTDKSYSFTLLPPGTYTLTPAKSGYSFTPATQTVVLASSKIQTVGAFTATADTGSILVKVTNQATGAGMAGVTVSVASADTTVVKSGTTTATGDALFSNLLAKGRTYIVSVSLAGYSSDAVQQTPVLPTNGFVSVQFKLTANTSSMAGNVVRSNTGAPLAVAQVSARRSSGEQYSTVTDANGAYSFKPIPGDSYTVIASKAGFRSDTTSFTLAVAESKQVPVLSLMPTTVNIAGSVKYESAGVPDLTVTAVSGTSVTTKTNASGDFIFTDLPVSPSADTTIYQITAVKVGLAPRSVKMVILKSQVGQTLSLPAPIILPSGRISFIVSDGVQPLQGVRVLFSPANGASSEMYTPASGLFASGGTLEKGIQRFSVSKDQYLSPGSNAQQIQLETDTTKKLSLTVLLPFRLAVPEEVTAASDAIISATCRKNNPADVATLYYKRESAASFATSAMNRTNDTTFSGIIPKQFSIEKLSYYVEVKRDTITYTAAVQTVVPTARGILSTLDIAPSLNGATIRPGDEFSIVLKARDGVSSAMGIKLIDPAQGKISWSSDTTAISIVAKDTSATIVSKSKDKTGVFPINVTAVLNGISVSQTFSVTVANVVMKDITIGGLPPGGELSNASRGLQLTASGRDTSGKSVNVGNSIQWMLSPATAGTISPRGLLNVDSTLLGKIVVTAYDAISQLSQKTPITVFATVDSSHEYYFSDRYAMELRIPKKAVNAPIDLLIEEATFGPAKKFVFVKSTGQNFVGSTNLYYLSYKGDALPGDSLKKKGVLHLGEDASLKFYPGDRMMGKYSPVALEWTILSSAKSTQSIGNLVNVPSLQTGLQTDIFSHLKTQYTLLVANQALGLTHVAVLPNPFSPDVAPLKIGYLVTTTDQQAVVSLFIYNIRGELVRTLLDGVRQYPGRYGSTASSQEITWDGKTNDGSIARNGRYVIQLRAKDSTGEKIELIQVVLIK